jgi:hypothetical protein
VSAFEMLWDGPLTELLLDLSGFPRTFTCSWVTVGSAAMALPVAFVNGALIGLSPGDGDTEVLEDMLPLLDDILDRFPEFGCAAS